MKQVWFRSSIVATNDATNSFRSIDWMTEVQQRKHFDGRRLGKLSALLAWVQILRLILSSTDFYIAAAIFFSVAAPYWKQ